MATETSSPPSLQPTPYYHMWMSSGLAVLGTFLLSVLWILFFQSHPPTFYLVTASVFSFLYLAFYYFNIAIYMYDDPKNMIPWIVTTGLFVYAFVAMQLSGLLIQQTSRSGPSVTFNATIEPYSFFVMRAYSRIYSYILYYVFTLGFVMPRLACYVYKASDYTKGVTNILTRRLGFTAIALDFCILFLMMVYFGLDMSTINLSGEWVDGQWKKTDFDGPKEIWYSGWRKPVTFEAWNYGALRISLFIESILFVSCILFPVLAEYKRLFMYMTFLSCQPLVPLIWGLGLVIVMMMDIAEHHRVYERYVDVNTHIVKYEAVIHYDFAYVLMVTSLSLVMLMFIIIGCVLTVLAFMVPWTMSEWYDFNEALEMPFVALYAKTECVYDFETTGGENIYTRISKVDNSTVSGKKQRYWMRRHHFGRFVGRKRRLERSSST